MRLAILMMPLLLAACATPRAADQARPATSSVADPATTLTQYHWRLEQATDARGQRIAALFARPDRPLQLDFQDGRLAIANACNRMGAPYALQDGRLQLGPMMSTKMACADSTLAALDDAIGQRVATGNRVDIHERDGKPVLALATPTGDRLVFAGEPTAATRFGGPGEVEFLEVAPQAVACAGASGVCLRVRELHYDAQGLRAGDPGAWHALDRPIEGFQHQAGVRNVLRVRRYGAPGDAGTLVLELVVESAPDASDPR